MNKRQFLLLVFMLATVNLAACQPTARAGERANGRVGDAATGTAGLKVSNTPLAVGARIPYRVMAFKLRGVEDRSKMRTLIDDCAQYHFTHVSLQCLFAGVKFDTLLKDKRFRFRSHAWTKAEVNELIDYITSKGMKVIPSLKLLTHQDPLGFSWSFKKTHPYMINKHTYDPNNDEVMSIVYGVVDEMIAMFTVKREKPLFFYVGHDEVAGIWPFNNGKWLDYQTNGNYRSDGVCNDRILTAAEFKMDVLHLYKKIVVENGIRLSMSNDVLIQRKEIPTDSRLYGHAGRIEGPTNKWVQVRHELPRDIIMTDWRYGIPTTCDGTCDGKKFPSFDIMQNAERFDVMGMCWPISPGNDKRMEYWVDHLLATGNDHCGIIAAQFYVQTLGDHFQETREIIRKTGTYAYDTVRK